MAQVIANRYMSEHRNKKKVGAGWFNQPTEFHPQRLSKHMQQEQQKEKETRNDVPSPPDDPGKKPPMYASPKDPAQRMKRLFGDKETK